MERRHPSRLHVLLTGEKRGLLRRLRGQSAGTWPAASPKGSPTRASRPRTAAGEPRGEVSRHLPPTAFVSFLQNHDQIGNRAFGERLAGWRRRRPCGPGWRCCCWRRRRRCCSWARSGHRRSRSCSSATSADLRDSVREGRRKEFASFPEFADPEPGRIPDPTAREHLRREQARLVRRERSPHRDALVETRRLLALRGRRSRRSPA